MSYVLFDDQFHSHRKVVDLFAGPCPGDAIAIYALALSWVGDMLTDGCVSIGFVVKSGLQRQGADELVRVKLWHRADDLCPDCRKLYAREDVRMPTSEDGYVIHGYLERNPSKKEVIAKREASANRKAAWRNKGRQEPSDVDAPECPAGTDGGTHDGTDVDATAGRTVDMPRRVSGTDGASHVPRPTPHSPRPTPHTPKTDPLRAGGAPAQPQRKRAVPRDAMGDQIRHAQIWDLFSVAFRAHYSVDPKRNAKVNGQISQFAKRIGESEWEMVIRTFFLSKNAYYVQRTHDFGCLLRDCETLYVQGRTGRLTTSHEARSTDRRAGRGGEYQRVIDELDAEGKEVRNAAAE